MSVLLGLVNNVGSHCVIRLQSRPIQ